jgi:hypothetical protein
VYIAAHLVISPYKQREQAGALLKVLPNGRIYHCPSGMSQEGAVVLLLSTF